MLFNASLYIGVYMGSVFEKSVEDQMEFLHFIAQKFTLCFIPLRGGPVIVHTEP